MEGQYEYLINLHIPLEVGTGNQSKGECVRGKQGLSCSAQLNTSRMQQRKQVATTTPNFYLLGNRHRAPKSSS